MAQKGLVPESRCSARTQRGVTLIEIMIVLAIGLLIGASLMTLFSQTIRTRNQIERAGQKTESGRFALNYLSTELRLAGFYGEFIPNAVTPVLNTLCDGGTERTNDLGTGWTATSNLPAAVRGIDSAAASGGTVDGCLALPDYRAGTDVLVVWRADTCTDAGGCPGSGLAPLTPRKKLYYVAECNRCDAAETVPIPTLKEMVMVAGASPTWSDPVSLVPGVEHLRVEFGVDSHADPADNDGNVDVLALANADGSAPTAEELPSFDNLVGASFNANGDNWDDVIAARISILVRDLQPTTGYVDSQSYRVAGSNVGPANDNFKRRVFSTTAALSNVQGRRER